MAHGRRAFIAYSPRTNRVYATIHAEFDKTHFPFRTVDQRVRGYLDDDAQLETLSLYHDMPNATIEDITERIKSVQVPCNTEWHLADVMQVPAVMNPVTPSSGDTDAISTPAAHLPAGSSAHTDNIDNTSLRQLQRSVFAHGRPAPYAEMASGWQAAGTKKIEEITNEELAEYLIGMDADIVCPPHYWPKDKCSWTVRCVEHNPDGRAKGGHRYKVKAARKHGKQL